MKIAICGWAQTAAAHEQLMNVQNVNQLIELISSNHYNILYACHMGIAHAESQIQHAQLAAGWRHGPERMSHGYHSSLLDAIEISMTLF